MDGSRTLEDTQSDDLSSEVRVLSPGTHVPDERRTDLEVVETCRDSLTYERQLFGHGTPPSKNPTMRSLTYLRNQGIRSEVTVTRSVEGRRPGIGENPF